MKIRHLSSAAVFAVIALAAALAAAQTPVPFSADVQVTHVTEGQRASGKMYFDGAKFRMDANAGGHESITISDVSKKVIYILMPQQQMYMEMHPGQTPGERRFNWQPYDASNPCANEPGVTCKKIGTDMVNGRMCNRWEFTGASGSKRTVWIDQKSHIPIKTVTPDMTMELTNIKEGPQPASLFEIPSGYQKMDMGGMMRGMKPPED